MIGYSRSPWHFKPVLGIYSNYSMVSSASPRPVWGILTVTV